VNRGETTHQPLAKHATRPFERATKLCRLISLDDSGNATVSRWTEKRTYQMVHVPLDRNRLDPTLHRPVQVDLDQTNALDTASRRSWRAAL